MKTASDVRLAVLAVLVSGCATRVGNPPKPQPASARVPQIADLVPESPGTQDPGDGGFAGAADFLKSLGTASPNHREVLAGVNALGAHLNALELEVDEALTETVEGQEIKIVVHGNAEDSAARQAVFCAGGAPFYVASWRDGEENLVARVDLTKDPLKAFAKVAEADRAFQVQLSYATSAERQELDAVLDGVPQINDPFVGELAHVTERTRYRTTATAGTIVYQTLQTWSADGTVPNALPQVTVAGRLAGGTDEFAIHHTEAKLVCPKALDRANADAPGWCLGYAADAAGKGQFKTAAEAQALWDQIKTDGFVDYATTARPQLDGVCAP